MKQAIEILKKYGLSLNDNGQVAGEFPDNEDGLAFIDELEETGYTIIGTELISL